MEKGVRLIGEIGIFSRHWRSFMEAQMRSVGVTHARWVTLWWIAEADPPLNQKALARRIGIEGPTLVRQLDILEKDGLIERVVDRDRRSRILRLKPAAIPIVDRIRSLADDLGRNVLEGIDEAKLAVFGEVLHQMRARLRERSGESFEPVHPKPTGDGADTSHSIAF